MELPALGPPVFESTAEEGSLEGLSAAESATRICTPKTPGRDRQLLVRSLERHYAAELKRISPKWLYYPDGPSAPPVDVARSVGVPPAVLGAIFAGRCRDQQVPATTDRQKRFMEWMHSQCSGDSFVFHDSGVGPECSKGVVLALALNSRFTSLDLSSNSLGDGGAEAIARVLPEHKTLLHLDLAANSIGQAGAAALITALQANQSLTHLDLSARVGKTRNRLSKANVGSLEGLLAANSVLVKLNLNGTGVGPEGGCSIAKGLAKNQTLQMLDLSTNEIGPKGAVAIAEVLGFCALEELNLSENRIGDEGLIAVAHKLGARPSNDMQTQAAPSRVTAAPRCRNNNATERIKAFVKYQDSLGSLGSAMLQFDPASLVIPDVAAREASIEHVTDSLHDLSDAVEMSMVEVPKLKALQLCSNGGSPPSFARVESLLQFNRVLEKLALDHCDHRCNENGWRSILTSLPVNTVLKSLSLAHCRLGSNGVRDLAKALAFNLSLESLCLRGNQFGLEAAAALGAVLATSCKSLKQLHLGSCYLDDKSGATIAASLAENNTLELLNLRDNALAEATGRGLTGVLRGQTTLQQLPLELNSIDLRWLLQIKKLLERNQRLREKAQPGMYRQRIVELEECRREACELGEAIQQNEALKERLRATREALRGEFQLAQAEEAARTKELEDKGDAADLERREVDEEIVATMGRLRHLHDESEQETRELKTRIEQAEAKIWQCKKDAARAEKLLEDFEKGAGEELSALKRELERAEKARASAELVASTAQQSLDSFASSVKAMRDRLAGGENPRQRFVQLPRPPEGRPNSHGGRRSLMAKANPMKPPSTPPEVKPLLTPRRPITPGRSGKVSPRSPRQ